MKKNDLKKEVTEAIEACLEKKAEDLTILELDQNAGAFTDYFVVCSGSNPRQVQAISDEVELRLKKKLGLYPHQIEGYKQAEWILLDYVDFVVHVFAEKARKFYDLERLWKSAKRVEPADLIAKPAKTKTKAAAKPAIKSTTVRSVAKKTARRKPKLTA
jgi:ribosome-associated protein